MLRHLTIIIVAATWTTFSFADDICRRVFEQKRRASQSTTNNLTSRDALGKFQTLLSTPIGEKFPSLGDIEAEQGTRNLIIVLPSTKARHELLPEELASFMAFESEYHRFAKQKALLESFFDKRSEDGCRRAMQEARFDYDAFCALAAQLSEDIVGRAFVEGEFLIKAINELRPHLKRPWEVARGYTAEEVVWLINAWDLRHVVIVGHGDDDGQLRDFQHNLLAFDTFYYLPPSIESLTFYSCHSFKAVDVYQVRDLFTFMPSNGKDRRLFYVTPQRIDNADNVALMGLFTHYLRTVDRIL